MTIIITFQYFVFKKDQPFQKSLKKEIEREDFLVNKRDLIIKKNLTSPSLTAYDLYLTKTNQTANRRDFIYTLSWVVPSYSLVRMASFIFLPFAVGTKGSYFAVTKLIDLTESTKKVSERLKDYPYGISAQRQINNFLAQPERDDIQKNILISEPVSTMNLKKVSFGYEKNKPVLKKLD
ncbi:7653_t:CDS:1 [Funneliformis geosporum]|nr:7653_t:CDS:1 [Funneliformis geosporum]